MVKQLIPHDDIGDINTALIKMNELRCYSCNLNDADIQALNTYAKKMVVLLTTEKDELSNDEESIVSKLMEKDRVSSELLYEVTGDDIAEVKMKLKNDREKYFNTISTSVTGHHHPLSYPISFMDGIIEDVASLTDIENLLGSHDHENEEDNESVENYFSIDNCEITYTSFSELKNSCMEHLKKRNAQKK